MIDRIERNRRVAYWGLLFQKSPNTEPGTADSNSSSTTRP